MVMLSYISIAALCIGMYVAIRFGVKHGLESYEAGKKVENEKEEWNK